MLLDGVTTLIQNNATVQTKAHGGVHKKRLPRGFKLPAIVAHRYGGTQENDFSGPTGIREDQIQIDVYAEDEDDCQLLLEAIRDLLINFTGLLPDGTKVQLCQLEREQDMPYLPYADKKADTSRSILAFRFVSNRV